ncbi:hypothetical protein AWENTII_000444 [Aspergillus wentii]
MIVTGALSMSVPVRASRQLLRGSTLLRANSTTAGCSRNNLFRSQSITTLTGCLKTRQLQMGSCTTSVMNTRLAQVYGQQRRWTATQKPSDQKDSTPKEPQNDSKTSQVLSKLPLKTHENIYTIPNILTFSRLVAAPLVGYFLVHDHHAAALSLFAYAGITDLVDGWIARRYNLQTVVGTIIDPMADKLLMTIGVACLAVNGSIPVWLAVIILGRDIGLAISAIYYRWISLPPPKTMARYWDFSLPSAEVKPTAVSKANTALQLVLVGSAIAMPVVPEAILDAWHLKEAMTGFQ